MGCRDQRSTTFEVRSGGKGLLIAEARVEETAAENLDRLPSVERRLCLLKHRAAFTNSARAPGKEGIDYVLCSLPVRVRATVMPTIVSACERNADTEVK